MKSIFSLLVLLFTSLHLAQAQAPNRVSIEGTVRDTTGETMPYATVMLLSPKDSSLLHFAASDDEGVFNFKNLKNENYLLKVTAVAQIPVQQSVGPWESGNVNVGNLVLKPIATQLMDVVVRAAKSQLLIKGDTIEYDASTFKVPPGSSVEDLLRQLPGIELDADGNIKAQGQDVQQVLVDGKQFFGGDAKMATRNLGADAVSKVQVFDNKTENEKVTGITEQNKDKALNLELKEAFKKGAFGKVTVGAGTEDRWTARGNYNRFDKKQQFSVIGYGNNINETGLNWDEYSEFRGQSNMFNDDDGDFGFSGGGNNRYWRSDGDGIMNYFDGRGFTKNAGVGTNYNYNSKDQSLNLNYTYHQTELDLTQSSFRQSFLPNNLFSNTDTLAENNLRTNHNVGGRYEWKIDTSNILIVKGDFKNTARLDDGYLQQAFVDGAEAPTNTRINNTTDDGFSRSLSSLALFRHKFKKAGRSFALSSNYKNALNDGLYELNSLNTFFEAQTFEEQIRQLNRQVYDTEEFKASALYIEPLSKRFNLDNFVNFSHTTNQNERKVTDELRGGETVGSQSVFYDNTFGYRRAGSSLRYNHDGWNGSVGLAAQQIVIEGKFSRERDQPLLTPALTRTYNNLTPNASLNYDITRTMSIGMDYSYDVSAPNVNDLLPVLIATNPSYQSIGNDKLSPESSHDVSMFYNYWNSASATHFGGNVNYSSNINQIVYAQTIQQVDSVGVVTTTSPINVDGGFSSGGYIWGGFPIIRNKLKVNLNGGFNQSLSPSFVNGIANETTSRGFNLSTRFTFTPIKKLMFVLGGQFNTRDITYSVNSGQDQVINSYGTNMQLKYQVFEKTFLESNYNYDVFKNERFGFNRSIPIWNASIRQLLGASNKFEIRLSAYDMLNRNVSIQQRASQNYVSREVAATLARYFLVSLSYNMKGYEAKIEKRRW